MVGRRRVIFQRLGGYVTRYLLLCMHPRVDIGLFLGAKADTVAPAHAIVGHDLDALGRGWLRLSETCQRGGLEEETLNFEVFQQTVRASERTADQRLVICLNRR